MLAKARGTRDLYELEQCEMQLKLRLNQILKKEEDERRWQEQAYKHLLGL